MRIFLIAIYIFFGVGSAAASSNPPIKVSTTLQASDDMTESDMTMEMLANFEDSVATAFLENSKQSFLQQGYAISQFDGDVR